MMLLAKWSIALIVAGGIALGLYKYSPQLSEKLRSGAPAAKDDSALRKKITTAEVRRQDLKVIFVESGKLRAIKSHPIVPTISRQAGQLKITWLADEGSPVNKGDKLVTFDTKDFEDNLKKLTADLERAKQDKIVKTSALDIAISTGKSNIKTAETEWKQADVEFKTYRDMEGPVRLNELDTKINEARGELVEADAEVKELRQQLDDQLFSDDEQKRELEERLRDARERAATLKRIVDSNQQQKKIFRQYEYPQQYDAKQQAVEKAELEKAKAKVTAEQEEMQKRAELQQVIDNIAQHERQINDINANIARCTLTAPSDGLVVYGDPSRPHVFYGQQMAVGSAWYPGNIMMTIPDMSAFEIDVNIPEEYRGRVKEGVPVRITLEAVPGVTLDGKLKSISQLGRQNQMYYDPDGARNFGAIVALDGHDSRMVSGMTAKVEIVADSVENALVVPVDALFPEEGNVIAWARETADRRFEKRTIKPGRRNDSFVEILEGLNERETVSLVEPEEARTSHAGSVKPQATPPAAAPATAPVARG